ncbi:hypothetical protein IE53DRAFT_391128, partial [Violaceomyces palustris]
MPSLGRARRSLPTRLLPFSTTPFILPFLSLLLLLQGVLAQAQQLAFLAPVQPLPASQIPKRSVSPQPLKLTTISLSTQWSVLGPFPAGMREHPLGGFGGAVFGSYDELLFGPGSFKALPSVYGLVNGSVSTKTFRSTEDRADPQGLKLSQTLRISYPETDWKFIRQTAGWASIQWQAVAATELRIDSASDLEKIGLVLDKAAEFALKPVDGSNEVLEWHNGDWYSYNRPPASINPPGLPVNSGDLGTLVPHVLELKPGLYKLYIKGVYENRIFGDPADGNPVMNIGIAIEVLTPSSKRLDSTQGEEISIKSVTKKPFGIVPTLVGGWLAGWGVGFALRNDGFDWVDVQSVKILGDAANSFSPSLLENIRIAPSQSRPVAIKMDQHLPLADRINTINVELGVRSLESDLMTTKQSTTISATLALDRKPSFHASDAPNADFYSFVFTYLASDGSLQFAAAVPPQAPFLRNSTLASGKAVHPPVILAVHGAGVEAMDEGWPKSFRRQKESWIILPAGRTPWGYDWQLSSLTASDDALFSFSDNLYGVPPNSPSFSDEEREGWRPDTEKVFVIGHSNGGQGSWYRMSRFPDKVIGGVVASGYLKVADYVQFDWMVGRHWADPALNGILRSSLSMFENDLHASNLAGIDLLVKYGSRDTNVPPWNSRDMAALVSSWNHRSGLMDKVRISEIPNKPHWFDGIFTDPDVQDAIDAKCTWEKNPGYKMPQPLRRFTLTVANPQEAGSKQGWRIIELSVPGRIGKLEVELTDGYSGKMFTVKSRNVEAIELKLGLSDIDQPLVDGSRLNVEVDGQTINLSSSSVAMDNEVYWLRKRSGTWERFSPSDDAWGMESERARRSLGPLIKFVSSPSPFQIILPSQTPSPFASDHYLSIAKRFSTDSYLYGRIDSKILWDWQAIKEDGEEQVGPYDFDEGNLLILGGPEINLLARKVLGRGGEKRGI